MTTTTPAPAAADWRLDLPPSRWHRPLLVLGAMLAVLTVVTLKVFLVDAAALTGLLRIFSFLGLGIALIGIGWAYGQVMRIKNPVIAP